MHSILLARSHARKHDGNALRYAKCEQKKKIKDRFISKWLILSSLTFQSGGGNLDFDSFKLGRKV
jgi:hypothetical protein